MASRESRGGTKRTYYKRRDRVFTLWLFPHPHNTEADSLLFNKERSHALKLE
ncbi:MAG: hypothetical protein RIB93_13995 [Coleofasciculus sp. D1-CHI-01]|uniref:hypothetical protein n=1 Tax=Coleofasciculus sp. D1-CHI-01 TaxID=3068482 RepID=UPI0032FD164F